MNLKIIYNCLALAKTSDVMCVVLANLGFTKRPAAVIAFWFNESPEYLIAACVAVSQQGE